MNRLQRWNRLQHLEAVILGCFSQISSSINQRSLSIVSRWRWKSIPTWPKSKPVSKWQYIFRYIYRERDHVSFNNNHTKSHQKTQKTVILAVGTRSVSGFLIMMLCRVSQVSYWVNDTKLSLKVKKPISRFSRALKPIKWFEETHLISSWYHWILFFSMFSAYTKTDCFRPESVIRDEIGSNLSHKMSLCHLLQLSVVVSSCVLV